MAEIQRTLDKFTKDMVRKEKRKVYLDGEEFMIRKDEKVQVMRDNKVTVDGS